MKKRYIILSFTLFSIDRLTKYLAFNFIKSQKYFNNFIKLKVLINRGISFGIFNSKDNLTFSLVTVSVTLITVFILIKTINKFRKNSLIWAEILILTGAISNIVDRIFYSGVIDFISINLIYLPTAFFNLADLFILIGAAMILFNKKYV